MTMYAADDIRSQLQTTAPSAQVDASTPVRPAQWFRFSELDPSERGEHGSATWVVRSANAVVAHTEAKIGDVFARTDQPDEYAVLCTAESAPVRVTSGDTTVEIDEPAFVVVPPGDSVIEVLGDGALVRLFSNAAVDLCEASLNAEVYREPDPRVAPLAPRPNPPEGFRIRVYPLAEAPLSEDRFGRIYRTVSLMVNFVPEEVGPRDASKLSPHFHDDFEQISFGVVGSFIHHIRYPWGPDSSQWRDDEHREIGTPSLCIIPPPTVHTSQGSGPRQQLLDIFSPPRDDFAAAGWVLNADDYPTQ